MVSADPFYGPIVSRIDNILSQYSAYVSENCKEWLVCNMYKNPAQFSPHSNFLSAELSRYANSYHFILHNQHVGIFVKYLSKENNERIDLT